MVDVLRHLENEEARQSTELVDPRTGELLSPEDTPRVADLLAYLREQARSLRDLIATVSDALIEECERQGTKTLHVAGRKVEVKGGTEIVWDIELLERLRDEGLPEDRWNQLVQMEVSYKVNAAVAKSIAASNLRYREVIEQARTDVEKSRYVTIR